MKNLLKKLFLLIRVPLDLIVAILAIPSSVLLKTYRKVGTHRLPVTTQVLRKVGVFPVRDHYYEPLFQPHQLTQDLGIDRVLPGIDLNLKGQLELLSQFKFAKEVTGFNWKEPASKPTQFAFQNDNFESGDAEFLYQFIRATKPNKIVEIGSGNSTKIAHLANTKNREETGKQTTHICIEPYEMPWLESLKDVQVLRQPIESSKFDWKTELKAGDLLFVDSSHMIRPQGDVLKEYLEIIPSLPSGVYVHVHDIFTPKDYPKQWIVDEVRFWNEQYLLEALLGNTSRYEIVGAVNFLKHHQWGELASVCPYLTPDREPGSFYFRTR